MTDEVKAKRKGARKTPSRPKTVKKKSVKKKRGKLPPFPRRGTVLGYVKMWDEPGWWPDLEWDPKNCFVPVSR